MNNKKDDQFIIISSDNKEFEIDHKVINYSQKLKSLLFEQTGPDNSNKIFIEFIDSNTISHILTFIKYNLAFKNDNGFNKRFVDNMDFDVLTDIILASKYLEVDKLFKLSSSRFRNIIKKSPNEIRNILNIDNDLYNLE